jgi:hypothetical protein
MAGETSGFSDDWQKWLALAAAAAAVGILPKKWQKVLAAASTMVWLLRNW